MSEQSTEQPEAAEPATPVDNSTTDSKRYAAYDKTYGKFLPGVFETKAKASAAAKDLAKRTNPTFDVGDVEIREV